MLVQLGHMWFVHPQLQQPLLFTVVAAEGEQTTYDPTELTLYKFLEIVDDEKDNSN